MNRYYYDLHVHSCLSPCGDADMTPNNIAGMAALKGLKLLALTDHNTCDNCPAFIEACTKNGVVGIAGMELTTSEEIHLLCLFEHLEDAVSFSGEVEKYRFKIKNKPEIFGEQLKLDAYDNIIGVEENLLINASALDIFSAYTLAEKFSAFVCPAHVDKQSNGIIGILGDFPAEPHFSYAEIADISRREQLFSKHANLKKCSILCSSDAHYLWDIHEAENYIELSTDSDVPEKVRAELFERLLSKE